MAKIEYLIYHSWNSRIASIMEPFFADERKRRKRENRERKKERESIRKFMTNMFEYKNSAAEEFNKPNPREFVPKKETVAKELAGVRKKAKDKDISLDHDNINLGGANEYLKFYGITTTDRTQLFPSNKKKKNKKLNQL